ncbi:MAG TPA: histidine kinase [Gemmatimonadales bacterium]|jgi:signal transduction histidine kinase|nr:histidine kinase [Gemmatimonadales bacterium]
MMRPRPPVWVFVSAAWLGPAILAAFQAYVQGRLGSREPATWRSLLWEGGDWLLYAILTPAVFWFARRYPLTRGTLARRVPIHMLAAILLCAGWAGGGILLSWALFRSTPYGGGVLGWFFTSLPFGVAVYFAVLGVEHAVFYFVEARERETQAARLSAQLAEARLGALRMQMQPHFLFNSLNAITVIVRDRDTATATRMLEHLGEMLRRVMRADRPQEVTLAEELDFVRQYLAIEEVRFSDRLRPVFAVDPSLLSTAVPEFLLQPLVENALRHGLAKRVTATLLRIEARREGDELVLTVTDDGPGPGGTAAEPSEGVGLGNTRERLATLYGDRARLELERTPEGGARVTVRLPYRELERARG